MRLSPPYRNDTAFAKPTFAYIERDRPRPRRVLLPQGNMLADSGCHMKPLDSDHRRWSVASFSVASVFLFVTLCGLLFGFTLAAVQQIAIGLFCLWGTCLIAQLMFAVAMWKRRLRDREGNRLWREKTSLALVAIGLCIVLWLYSMCFLASWDYGLRYGEETGEWVMGLGLADVFFVLPAEFVILVTCSLVASKRLRWPIVLLQVANLVSAMIPLLYLCFVPL